MKAFWLYFLNLSDSVNNLFKVNKKVNWSKLPVEERIVFVLIDLRKVKGSSTQALLLNYPYVFTSLEELLIN